MARDAAKALPIIRRCVEAERIRLGRHFRSRLAERNLLWTDVFAVLDDPNDVRDARPEKHGRPKWIVAGDGADGSPLEVVCVLDRDEAGNVTVFVTLY